MVWWTHAESWFARVISSKAEYSGIENINPMDMGAEVQVT